MSDVIGVQGCMWKFDYGVDQVLWLIVGFFGYGLGYVCDMCFEDGQFGRGCDQWDYYFGYWFYIGFFFDCYLGFENGVSLYFVDFWIGDIQLIVVMFQYWIVFCQVVCLLYQLICGQVGCCSNIGDVFFGVWQEFVQWWIQQVDCGWMGFYDVEDGFEIIVLYWQDFVQCCYVIVLVVGQDYFVYGCDMVGVKEYVFGMIKVDVFSVEFDGCLIICWGFCICVDFYVV